MTSSIFPIIDVISSIEPYSDSYTLSGVDFDETVDLSIQFYKPLAHAALNSAISGFLNYQRRLQSTPEGEPLPPPTLDSRADLEDSERPSALEVNEALMRGERFRTTPEKIRAEAVAAAKIYNTLYEDLAKGKDTYSHAMTAQDMVAFRLKGDPTVDVAQIKMLQDSMRIDEETAKEILVAEGYKRMSVLAESADSILAEIHGAGKFTEDDAMPEISLVTQLRWINKVVTKTQDASNARIIRSMGNANAHRRALTANEFIRAACSELLKLALNMVMNNHEELHVLSDMGIDIPDNSESGIREAVVANLKRRIAKTQEVSKDNIDKKVAETK